MRLLLRLVLFVAGVMPLVQCQMCFGEPPSEEIAKYGRKLSDAERLQALAMLTRAMRANYEKIRTWKGEYHFIDRQRWFGDAAKRTDIVYSPPGTPPQLNHGEIPTGKEAGGGVWEFGRGSFQFALDQSAEKYRLFYDAREPVGYLDVATGAEGWHNRAGFALQGLLTPEYSIVFDIKRRMGPFTEYPAVGSVPASGNGRVAYRHASRHRFAHAKMFDTRDFFLRRLRYCERTLTMLRGDSGNDLRKYIEQSLSIYVNDELPPIYTEVRTRVNPEKGSDAVLVYDGKVGFNVVRDRFISNDYREEEIFEYQNVSGVFIPKTYGWDQHDVKEGKLQPNIHRSFKLLSTELNGEIPAEEFELKSLGFQYGERMIDRVEKKLYVYDDQIGFVPAERFQFEPNRVVKD